MPASPDGSADASSSDHTATGGLRVLAIDIGGTNVKILLEGEKVPRKFPSGPKLTPKLMVEGVKKLAGDWKFGRVSIGYPGAIRDGRPIAEPAHLAKGWRKFDFAAAFGCPVRIINDAAMQALGSYDGGKMLFLGLGTGLGSAMVVEGQLLPMELGHLPVRKRIYEYYVGVDALKRYGKRKWLAHVKRTVDALSAALLPDYVVLGGGNVKQMKKLPKGCRAGANENAFVGGFRLWDDAHSRHEAASNS